VSSTVETLDPTSAVPHPCPVVVIGDAALLQQTQEALGQANYQVEACADADACVDRVAQLHPALLFVDLELPDVASCHVVERAHDVDAELVIIAIARRNEACAGATACCAVEAMRAGACDVVCKPLGAEQLCVVAGRGLERWRLRREAERLRREKDEEQRRFVAFVSHQLRAPPAAVKQYLDVLLFTARDQLPATALDWIGRCQARMGEMLEITDDWLTLARIERKELCDHGARTALGDVVAQVTQLARPRAEAAGVTLEGDVPLHLPFVRGDTVAISTLVSNLVDNAIKYNRHGGRVTVSADADAEVVTLAVSDTGLGIPAECLPRLFHEFYRVRAPAVRAMVGSGLGLAICKHIATELGGEIAVDSVEGQGSTFTVRLPLAGI
jgi:signal transduction histidine kinase